MSVSLIAWLLSVIRLFSLKWPVRYVNAKKAAGVTGGMEAGLLGKVSELTEELYTKSAALDEAVAAVPTDDNEKAAHYYHDVVISAMDEVRAPADKLEGLVGKKFWPFPTYSDILFYV